VKVVCCVCKKVIKDGDDHPVSHGICWECAEDYDRALDKMSEKTSDTERCG